MTLTLSEVPNRKEHLASKPGYLIDRYIRVQEINNAVDECMMDIEIGVSGVLSENFLTEKILNKIDKWLKIKIRDDKDGKDTI